MDANENSHSQKTSGKQHNQQKLCFDALHAHLFSCAANDFMNYCLICFKNIHENVCIALNI